MAEERKSRIAILRERVTAVEETKAPTWDVPFRGVWTPIPKIKIRADFPLYRIQSGRTRSAQSQYLDEHPGLSEDFFKDPEDPRVQQAQYQILLRMISEKGLAEDLDDRGQLAPLVLTFDGFVVDGNRRLAALREAGQEYVEAVVLPADAQSQEIYETEIELQMQRETKAPYNWIDQALHIEYGIQELGETVAQVAKRMRLRDEDIQVELAKLQLVRQYLEWLREPGKYHKVPSDSTGAMEQAFIDLAERLKSPTLLRKPEAERRMIRLSCFAVIKGKAGYKQVRSLIRHLSQRPAEVVERLRAKKPEILIKSGDKGRAEPEVRTADRTQDPLELVASIDPVTVDAATEQLVAIVTDANKAGEAGPVLLEIVEDIEAEEKEAKRQQRPLQRVQHALNDLEKAEVDGDTEGLDEIARMLAQILDEAERLRRAIEEVRDQT